MLLTPDEKLIHSILQGGIQNYYKARTCGVREDSLYDEAKAVWNLMGKMTAKDRLPSLPEIELATGHTIDKICEDPLDIELCSEAIVKRGLSSQLHEKFGELTRGDAINTDPFKVRDSLSEVITETAWSFGEPYSLNSRASMDELSEAYAKAEARKGGLIGVSSPWPTMDEASLGLQPGELTVCFAKRKVGKSWLVIAWSVHMWRHDLKPGEKVLFVTMEMTPLQVLRRMACVDLRLSWDEFRGGRLTSKQKDSLHRWVDARMNAGPDDPNMIIVGSNQVRTISDLAAVVGEHRPKVVVVDSFYILGRSAGSSIYERVLANVQGMKLDIALKYDVPVLASTQLKGTTNKDVLTADSDDAMGAKAIGDYADVTRGLFADTELKSAQQRLWRGMEAREFLARDVKINFNLDTMDFSEIEEIDPDDPNGRGNDDGEEDDEIEGDYGGGYKGPKRTKSPIPRGITKPGKPRDISADDIAPDLYV